jgi:hypothetical protein
MHRALEDHGVASERGPGQYAMHGGKVGEPIIGRVIGKGLAGDEMGDRLHLVIDGVDGRAHYVETTDHSKLDEIGRGHIVALEPARIRTGRGPRISISVTSRMRPAFIAPAPIWQPPALK